MNRVDELQKLGRRIKAVRMQQKLTQNELAVICKVNRNYIGMLERGERNPTYITLVRIAEHLKISLSQLID
jgi:transcriptional regulator with XRE-family HTH domain